MKQTFVVRPCTLRELAAVYGVSAKVMKTWLKGTTAYTGEKRGRFYTARQAATIFRLLGIPHQVTENMEGPATTHPPFQGGRCGEK